MGKSNFENLRIYKQAEDLADAIWEIVSLWNSFAKDTVGKQMVRAFDSIGANIAEGAGRGSSPDNRRFIRYARGSLNEARHWLRRAYRRNLLTPGQIDKLVPFADNLAPQLNAFLNSIGRKKNSGEEGNTIQHIK